MNEFENNEKRRELSNKYLVLKFGKSHEISHNNKALKEKISFIKENNNN